MSLKTRKDYVLRECEESIRILKDEMNGIGDKDIHNLELILYSIKPYSYWWRRGCISSLRKAIKALILYKKRAFSQIELDDIGCDDINKNRLWVTPDVYECLASNRKGVFVLAQGKPLMKLRIVGKGK